MRELFLNIVAFLIISLLIKPCLAKNILEPEIIVKKEMNIPYITSISADRENKYFLITSQDNTLRLWDENLGKMLRIFNISDTEGIKLYRGLISPDGKRVTALTSEGVYIFDTNTGKVLKQIRLSSGYVIYGYYYWFEISYSENAKIMAIYRLHDNTTNIYDTEKYELIKALNGKIFFSPTGDILSFDGKSVFIYSSKLKLKKKLKFESFPNFISFSPDGKMIAIGEISAKNEKRFLLKIDIFLSDMRKVTDLGYEIDGAIYKFFWSIRKNILYVACGELIFSNINKLIRIDIFKRKFIDIIDLSNIGKVLEIIYLKNNRFVAVTDNSSIAIFTIFESEKI